MPLDKFFERVAYDKSIRNSDLDWAAAKIIQSLIACHSAKDAKIPSVESLLRNPPIVKEKEVSEIESFAMDASAWGVTLPPSFFEGGEVVSNQKT